MTQETPGERHGTRGADGRFVSGNPGEDPVPGDNPGTGDWMSGGIDTPAGLYVPQTDCLPLELKAAARFAGLSRFKVFVNGTEIKKENQLPTQSISALQEIARVAGTETSAQVAAYDKAG